MKDKEMIEEMAIEDIVKVYPEISRPTEFGIIKILETEGYRKLPKNSVVLSREEHAKLVAQVRQEFEHEYKDKVVLSREEYDELLKIKDNCIELMKQGEQQILNIGKETAEKIIKMLKQPPYIDFIESWVLEDVAKQFGVEIKG